MRERKAKSIYMAKILMFGNQKGGVGKSICSMITATALSQPPFNLKTVVLDIDDQKSIYQCRNIDIESYPEGTPPPFAVIPSTMTDLQKNIGRYDQENHLIIIDAAGKLDVNADVTQQEITKAMMYVDYLFMPFVAGAFNFTASFQYLTYAQQVQLARQLQNRKLNVFGFVNMYRSRSRSNNFLLEDIKTLDIPFMENYLGDYTLIKDADSFVSLYDAASNDSAKQNFTHWLNELAKKIKIIE